MALQAPSATSPYAPLRWVVLAMTVVAAIVLAPLVTPLVLALWTANVTRPLVEKLVKRLGGRHRAAGGIVVGLVLALVAPLTIVVVSLVSGGIELGRMLAASKGTKSALVGIVAKDPSASPTGLKDVLGSPESIMQMVQEHGASAVKVASGIAATTGALALAVFVFFYALYVFLVDGKAQYAWLETHSPLAVTQTKRFADAFQETGRGLLVGVGLTGLAQGTVATIAYLALGVPRALVLGLVTCFVSIIPSVGTALVWVPVSIGLYLSGKPISAAILAGIGFFVIGSTDNLLRPVFARFGKLSLSTFALLMSMLGGVAVFGGAGLVLGPLVVRLAKEGLALVREARDREASEPVAAVVATPPSSTSAE